MKKLLIYTLFFSMLGVCTSYASENSLVVRYGMNMDELKKHIGFFDFLPYEWAMIRFPDVQSCLEDAGDVNSFAWRSIKSLRELEICLSRVHSFIGSVPDSARWFENQGFTVMIRSFDGNEPSHKTYTVYGDWITSESNNDNSKKSPLTGWRIKLAELLARSGLGLGIAIEFNAVGAITHVFAGYTYL